MNEYQRIEQIVAAPPGWVGLRTLDPPFPVSELDRYPIKDLVNIYPIACWALVSRWKETGPYEPNEEFDRMVVPVAVEDGCALYEKIEFDLLLGPGEEISDVEDILRGSIDARLREKNETHPR